MNHAPSSPAAFLRLLLPAIALSGCGIPGTESDVKLPGVGVNPDEVGTDPEESGGLIEYDWVEFAGGQLSLASIGLLAFDEAGPKMVDFKPPYAIVNGTGFVFDTAMPRPDAQFGSFAAPPDTVGTCQTVFEPQAYLSNVSDLGNAVSLFTEDGSKGFRIGRRPYVYPPDVQYVFPYYSEIASWRSQTWNHKVPGEGESLADMVDDALARPNFPFGETVYLDFPGGLPPAEATFGSVPLPMSAMASDNSLTLPNRPQGYVLEWNGPRFDPITLTWKDGGTGQKACLRFEDSEASLGMPDAEVNPSACLTLPEPPDDGQLYGQIYTPPWKTDDGAVTFRWDPATNSGDTVSVSVRFLGAVDETDYYFVEDKVVMSADPRYDDIAAEWNRAIADGEIPAGTPLPEGYRESLACDPEDDVQWVFDPALRTADGGYLPSLQGDPLHTMVEVTCTVDASAGEFTLTTEQLAEALDFADLYGAAGAVFYVAHTQRTMVEIPPVRDNFGHRRDIPPVTVVGKAVQVGRFWYDR